MPNPLPLYDAGFQGKKVAGLTLFALVCAPGALLAGWELWLSFGLAPADGGVLRPAWQRALLGGGVASLGIGFVAAMLVYARCYVLQIWWLDDQTLQVQLRWPGHTLRVTEHDVVQRRSHAGISANPRGVSVQAPWLGVWLRGRRLPLIIDDQGEWSADQPVPPWLDPDRARWLAPQPQRPGPPRPARPRKRR